MSGEPKASVTEEPPDEGAPGQSEPSAGANVREESASDGASDDGSPQAAAGDEASGQSPPQAVAENEKKGGRGKKRTHKKGAETKASESKSEPDRPEPVKGAYHVALPAFEGPLDLLLHLIQQHELDIKDIPMAFVSQKYVEYIMLMQELNIDMASEYLVMAATLAHIKSKMLLPKPPVDQEDDAAEDFDPRSELVRRLLEYQKYKHAAEQLGGAPVLGRDVFLRGAPAPMVDGPAPLAPISVFKLFDAFQKLLSKAKQQADHLIDVDRISISERIIELTDFLREKGRVAFASLFDETMTRSDLIVSFLALLEMTRLRMMLVHQEGPLEPIEIELTLAEEHDEVLAQAEQGDVVTSLAGGDLETAAGVSEELADEDAGAWGEGDVTPEKEISSDLAGGGLEAADVPEEPADEDAGTWGDSAPIHARSWDSASAESPADSPDGTGEDQDPSETTGDAE